MKKYRYIYFIAILIILIVLFSSSTRGVSIKNIVNKLPKKGSWKKRRLEQVNDITIHHSASPTSQTAYDFARYHINKKGWVGIGYHFVIDYDGTINQTNELTDISYHNGFNNTSAIGVCLVGDFTKISPSKKQTASLDILVNYLKDKVKNVKMLNGHKEYLGSTSCPGGVNTEALRKKHRLKKYVKKNGIMEDIQKYNNNEADN